jgi:predicted flavoprotein YhiN
LYTVQRLEKKQVDGSLVTLMARDLELIKQTAAQIMRQIKGMTDEDDILLPEYGITGPGILYCYEYGTRAYIKIDRGQKAYMLDENPNHLNRVLIYTSCGKLVEIDFDELICTEFD